MNSNTKAYELISSEKTFEFIDFNNASQSFKSYTYNLNDESGVEFHILHGYTESCHYMWPFINQAIEKNYQVTCFELPGHGNSTGNKYDIDNFYSYLNHLEAYIKTLKQGKKHFFIAHSTGAVGITKYLQTRGHSPFEKIYLVSPLTRPNMWSVVKRSVPLLSRVISKIRRVEQIRSKEYNKTRDNDPHYYNYVPINWTLNCIDFVENQTNKSYPEIDNIISIFGNKDSIIDYKHGIKKYQSWFPNGEVKTIQGGAHHIHFGNESIKNELFSIIFSNL